MDRVLDRLYISAAPSIGAPLQKLGFVALVDLRDQDDVRGGTPKLGTVEVFQLGNRDGDPWIPDKIEAAYEFITKQIRRGRVLVSCGAGMSRSASLVIGYLVAVGHDPATAYTIVRRARAKVAPLPAMLGAALDVALGDTPASIAVPTKEKIRLATDRGKEF